MRLKDNHGTPLVMSGNINCVAMKTPNVMPITPQTIAEVNHNFALESGVSGKNRSNNVIPSPQTSQESKTQQQLCAKTFEILLSRFRPLKTSLELHDLELREMQTRFPTIPKYTPRVRLKIVPSELGTSSNFYMFLNEAQNDQ